MSCCKRQKNEKELLEDDMINEIIPTPCVAEVERYIEMWDSLENYVLQENSLDKLFFELIPNNKKIEDILIKASTLNDFYSTNIFSIFPVAQHILNLDIDARLAIGDPELVTDIAKVKISGKDKYLYSFASKYCSHHKPLEYPIYDSYVEKVLVYFAKRDQYAKFSTSELKDYRSFKTILISFSKYYGLDDYNLKNLDRYLWLLGKEYFPKKYY